MPYWVVAEAETPDDSDRIRHVLTVFLASPSDLGEERRAAFASTVRVNRILGRTIGWQVDLLGWEDTLPGAGRPQGLINRDVDRCHLFVGMLWRRWGQATGEYSSGFEEELERAAERRARPGNAPEIWLFFKEIAAEHIEDPGEQLRLVLQFKERTYSEHRFLAKDFTSDQWSDLFLEAVLRYVLELAGQPTSEPSAAPTDLSLGAEERALGRVFDSRLFAEEGAEQIQSLLRALGGAIRADPGLTALSMTDLQVARLGLLATALSSERLGPDLLGSHETNMLYEHRREIEPLASEAVLLIRGVLAGEGISPRMVLVRWQRRFAELGHCGAANHCVVRPHPSGSRRISSPNGQPSTRDTGFTLPRRHHRFTPTYRFGRPQGDGLIPCIYWKHRLASSDKPARNGVRNSGQAIGRGG
jgi:hypothetical protein